MNDDLLLRLPDLADLDDRAIPPLEQIQGRARAIRLARRRARAAVGVGLGATALVVGGVLIPQAGGAPGGGPQLAEYLGVAAARAADGSAADCFEGGEAVTLPDRASWTGNPEITAMATLLPPGAGAAPLRGVSARGVTSRCAPAVPAAVFYDDAPVRGVSVWPDVAQPYDPGEGLVEREVRGQAGQLMALPDGELVLSWVEPDGVRWLAEGSGLSADDLVGVLDGLHLSGHEVAADGLPAGYTAAEPQPAASATTWTWEVQCGSPGAAWTNDRLILVVRTQGKPPAAFAARYAQGVTFTQVNGRLAVFVDGGAGDGTVFWQADGLSYALAGHADAEGLVTLAEQLQPVAPDDPRVMAAPDLADVPDMGH